MDALSLLGYAGSLLIAVSLSMTHVRRLRWINLAGASTFATYGVLVGAWPVALLNGYIVLADAWHLARMSRRREYFSLLELPERPSPFLRRFLEHHRADIARIVPGFDPQAILRWEGMWILRDMLPVGLFVYESGAQGTARVILDYVIPSHRDLKNARWLLGEGSEALRRAGVRRLMAGSETPGHRRYLERIGFRPCEDGSGRLCLELPVG
jgi:hypothetical protein